MEGDGLSGIMQIGWFPFQSTPSVWRETYRLTVSGGGKEFQSTPSVWRETSSGTRCLIFCGISIHSLRVEGDAEFSDLPACLTDFNPLPPCGGRPKSEISSLAYSRFQSTPSVWRETQLRKHPINAKRGISIHSLRVEGDGS